MLLLALALVQQDVLVLKDGKLAVGTITEVADDGITFRGADGATRKVAYAELDPYSAYEARRSRINVDSSKDHLTLAEFCLAQKLYRFAIKEFRTAAELDPELKVDQKISDASAADAQALLAEAATQLAQDRIGEAAKALRTVIENYPDRDEAKQAKEKLEALTAKLEEENKKKEEQKAKAEKALKASKDEIQELKERTALARATKFIEDAKRYWGDGMDREGEGRLKEADRAWKDSVERLNLAHAEFAGLVESNDIEMIKTVKALRPEANEWMIRSFNSLAQMYVNNGQFQEATLWVNQALKIAPDNALAQTLKLEITRALLRQKNP